ncbi:hypothetical protein [Acetobacter persici]|uniref:Uncharacterized protein n=1 Tax=Acetobacter persici TaxID=1076596 RepID=A0A1U9LK10_9PROT|nr:hypothetical protein [Acetobacter persici]AQT06679.1 hypothetical protein A0U91_16880 [Acetobacter persici]
MDHRADTVLKNCGFQEDDTFPGDFVLHLKDTPAFLCPPGPDVNCYCEERIEIHPNPDGSFDMGLLSLDDEFLTLLLLGARLEDVPMFTIAAANITAMSGDFTTLYNAGAVEVINPFAKDNNGDWVGSPGMEGTFILTHPDAPEYKQAAADLLQKVVNYSPEHGMETPEAEPEGVSP